ncbi:beta-1,3-galactosyl-O-glycosyl-glycoprotein beta-1,6-N-acetylglucosaminyltransferase 4-like [Sphaeramia orbicularis]|nr:beta-1,3-galactosyl-O-glycosyl-glycoprotein beta-1,6-N-acetylglucosaminyltransferase 4-like [Sphaeramia orbicularis]
MRPCARWGRSGKRFLSTFLSLLTLCVLLLISSKFSPISERPPPAAIQDIKTFHKYSINCSAIYDMDPVEVGKSLVMRKQPVEDKDASLINLTSDCTFFMKARGYDDVCISEEERDYPLAYSLVVHKSAWMVERLIKSLYSPSNIYCIHYDKKSSAEFVSAMEGLSRCLPNVFIASKLESVYYASISRLNADLNCMSDLVKSQVKWKYLINMCGQDFPLKSNVELVSELKMLKGASMLETSKPTEYKMMRVQYHHELKDAHFEYLKIPMKTDQMKAPPPHGIEIFSGSAYFVLSREFVDHIHSSPVVKDFLAWSEDTYSPDEHFWATLARLPGVPGEIPRNHPDITDLMSRTRLVKWEYLEENIYPHCTGQHQRSVCIFGVGELRWLLDYGHWFANKFDPKVDPIIIQCLEETLEKKQKLFRSMASTTCH